MRFPPDRFTLRLANPVDPANPVILSPPSRVAAVVGRLLLSLALLFPLSCQKDAVSTGPAWFEDISTRAGVQFTHNCGVQGQYFMPEVIGSGVALFDYDQDGRLDLYFIQNGGPQSGAKNRLYHQRADGSFEDVTGGSGLDVAGHGMGAAAADATNDGLPEVLLTEYGAARLFVNEKGSGKFRDVTRAAGIDNPAWGTSAAWVDYDRDGWLDLVIANYVLYSPTRVCSDQAGKRDYCGPQPFPGSVARLFRNRGVDRASGEPRFEDVTLRSGLGSSAGPGLGVVPLDFDGDRWTDLFVANDGKPNHLWVNQRDGTFREEAILRGLAYNGMGAAQANMGIAVGDVDGDGAFDLYITHLTEELHAFYRQGPRGLFSDQTAAAGLANTRWRSTGFGALFADFDLDGNLDLVQANGRVKFTTGPSTDPKDYWSVYRERNQLFGGDGRASFTDISPSSPALCGTPAVWRSLAAGDLDNDGAMDLVATRVDGAARVLRNVAPRRGHWLSVRAVEPALGARDAIGAEIIVSTPQKKRWAAIVPSQSYLASCDPRAHFGLGDATAVDSIEVLWPDGSSELFPGGVVDRLVVLRHGTGTKP